MQVGGSRSSRAHRRVSTVTLVLHERTEPMVHRRVRTIALQRLPKFRRRGRTSAFGTDAVVGTLDARQMGVIC